MSLLFATIFIIESFRTRQFSWLITSLLLWLGAYVLLAYQFLPFLHFTTPLQLNITHAFIFISSLIFWCNQLHRYTPQKWQFNSSQLLSLIALSSLIMHIVYLLLIAMVWATYPNGVSGYLVAKLLEFYMLNPSAWYIITATLMLMLHLHSKINQERSNIFSREQFEYGILFTLFMQSGYIIMSLTNPFR
ncbi:hypothetical protein QDY71_07740 [Kingella negevensis]|uniref:Uncharacterized protein n=1 Tax=Kingella negevensis TaxID=1522312 RepID=A0A238HH53_9NEIS|nr:hypothetical protein [Kingella negevensis]MDK4680754.1 hypothetical protein [Kingella negevensis]MDK4681523.1 hypothetical protein [Kingella negevensis]MDK4683606.1 hypothetical protein [Kingella negevensis]MDK4691910.1 hypothetical protein [Kingella negevensis]MDK4692937.1 hypothetical protein [Kingella negevensis]